MGDAVVSGASRMGLTLQGYDQVISLSQTNINQTLKRYFNIDSAALASFEAVLGPETDPDYTLIGNIQPPTIELIDADKADKADQAIYTIEFKKDSWYTYWGADPNNRRGAPEIETVSRRLTLAFFVNFGLEKCKRMPAELQETVRKTGSYSIDQLVIIFGTAALIEFNWTDSRFPGLDDLTAQLDAKTKMSDFISKWLMSLKTAAPGKSHNVLGYSVKLDVEGNPSREQLLAKIGNVPPSFPLTNVQFQTIANKLSAGANGALKIPTMHSSSRKCVASPASPLRGRCRKSISNGAPDHVEHHFLREFVGKLVEPIHKECSAFADTLAKRQTWDAEYRINRVKNNVKFLGTWVDGLWLAVGNQWVLESTATSSHAEIPWEDNNRSFTVQVIVQANMTSALKPVPGTGNFHIKQTL
ncbi:hypothetical protein B0H63DRAFT_454716 [Podospora didyma]|uniref:Uncharacterized protein n=1 Tax=Podospora didyma TaxID=330526 RepID=A0AAE0K5N1_9PEZI|nr:hypothetical protein B0H63DRAFT_454716 [Podospora didyma]